MASNTNTSSGIGLGGILFVVFLVMKLMEIGPVAHWSWWVVTAPLWGPFALVLAIWIIVSSIVLVAEIFGAK